MSLLKELKTGIQYNSIKIYKYRSAFKTARMPEIARVNVSMEYNVDPVYASSFKYISKKYISEKGHMLTLRDYRIIRKRMVRSSFSRGVYKGDISYYDRIKGCFLERAYRTYFSAK